MTADYHTFGAGGLAAANNWSAFNIFGAGIDVNGTAELDGFVVYPCAGSVGNPALDGPSINLLLYSGFLHVKATGNCYLGSAAFTLTAVSNASGGTTTYTGTITGGASNAFANQYATISGFTNVANSGTWVVTASTATTITVNNTYGVAETHAGTANVNGAIIVPSLSHLDLKTATVTVGTSNATPPYSAGAITDVDATNPTTVSFSCTATASSNLLTGCSPATLAASDFEQSMECVAGLGAATNLKTVISNVVSSSSVYLNDAFGSTFSTGTVACTETIRTHDFKIELGDVEHATHSNWGTMLVNHCNRAYVIGGYENDQSGDWVNVSLDCDDSRFDTMYINGAKDGIHFIGPQQNPRATGTFYTADDAVAFDTGENCCSVSLTLTAAANASGGSTVYTGTITGGASNALANQYATISGFTNGANNGTWRITASTATTITVSNPSGVAETHAGTAFIPLLIYNASGSINNLYAEVSGGGGSRGVAVETIAINPSGTQCIIPSITNGVVIVHGDGLYTGSTSGQAGYGGYVVPVDIGTGSLNSCTTAPSKVLADNLTVMADGSAPYGYYTLLYSGLIGTQFGKITVFNPPNLNAQPVATLPYAAGAVSTYSDTNKSMTIANLQIVGAQAYSGSMKLFNSANSTGGTTTISLFNSDGPNPADYNTSGVTITTNNSAYTAAPASGGPNCMQISTTGQITNTGSACGSGSAGVSSFTGDGALLNNSASTGVVTATLASTGVGYGVWGNTGSSSAAPGYHALSSYPAVAFPTLNQSTTGSAASLSISGQTGLLSFTGLTSTNRIKTMRDAADTILELGGGYTPTGTWNWTSCSSCVWPTFNQNTTGNAATATNIPYSGLTGTVPTWNQNTTGNAATATQATNATNVNGGTVSATTGTFSGAVNEPSIVAPASSPATDSASLGPELTTSGTCTGTGWTGTYPTYTPPGTTAPLTCTGFTSGSYYQTVTTLAGNTGGGTLTIVIGTAQVATASGASGVTTAGLKANGTSLTYTPTAALNGTVTISAKLISPITTFSYQGKDSTGALSGQMLLQGLGSLNNLFIGGGGIYNTTGTQQHREWVHGALRQHHRLQQHREWVRGALRQHHRLQQHREWDVCALRQHHRLQQHREWVQALYTNTTGYRNTANGYQALYSNTTGYYNTANGYTALYANTTGYNNTANGMQALYANTTGTNNTANGFQALYANTTGSSNTANGMYAGQYIADGVTANQTSSNSVYEGFRAYPLASGDTNENVIGNGGKPGFIVGLVTVDVGERESEMASVYWIALPLQRKRLYCLRIQRRATVEDKLVSTDSELVDRWHWQSDAETQDRFQAFGSSADRGHLDSPRQLTRSSHTSRR